MPILVAVWNVDALSIFVESPGVLRDFLWRLRTTPATTLSRSFRAVFPRKLPKKFFGNDSFHRRDRFRQIFVQIGAILAIFRPFELFGRFWGVNGALMAR